MEVWQVWLTAPRERHLLVLDPNEVQGKSTKAIKAILGNWCRRLQVQTKIVCGRWFLRDSGWWGSWTRSSQSPTGGLEFLPTWWRGKTTDVLSMWKQWCGCFGKASACFTTQCDRSKWRNTAHSCLLRTCWKRTTINWSWCQERSGWPQWFCSNACCSALWQSWHRPVSCGGWCK